MLFRPAFIRGQRGIRSRVALYRVFYAIFGVLYPLARAVGHATTTTELGRAMIAAARGLSEKQVLDSPDINELAARLPPQP